MDVNTLDISSPENLANPYPLYRQLRELHPIFFDRKTGFHFITRYKDVRAVLTSSSVSSSRRKMLERVIAHLEPGCMDNYLSTTYVSMIQMDPPEHNRLRAIAAKFFTKTVIASWQSIIYQNFLSLFQSMSSDGAIDLAALAQKYPANVICDIFGLPMDKRDRYIKNAAKIANFFGAPIDKYLSKTAQETNQASLENRELIIGLIEERVTSPKNDLLTTLAEAYQKEQITLPEVVSMCSLLLTAGHVTTAELLCNGIYQLLSHPEQWQWLQQNLDRIPDAIEEILRFDTSVPFTIRQIKQDINLDGCTLPAGSLAALGLAAANHDPELCSLPEQFDITRGKTRHLSFAAGPHVCVGAIMAREEMRIAIELLIQHCPRLRFHPLYTPQRQCSSLMFRGFKELQLKF